jgi:hypothetical protein
MTPTVPDHHMLYNGPDDMNDLVLLIKSLGNPFSDKKSETLVREAYMRRQVMRHIIIQFL